MNGRRSEHVLAHLPLSVFGAVYAASFFFGAVLLLVGPSSFIRLYARTGIRPFWLEPGEVLANWLLILVGPAFFAAGWIGWSRRPAAPPAAGPPASVTSLPLRSLAILYVALLLGGLVSLGRAGALARVGSWFDYGYFLQTRFLLLERLSFIEWMVLYTLLPTSAGLFLIGLSRSSWKASPRRLAIAGVVLSLLATELLLFQKRYALLSLFFLAACAVVNAPEVLASRRKALARASGFAIAIYLAYCALAVASTMRRTPVVVQSGTTELLDALRPPAAAIEATAMKARAEAPAPASVPGRSPAFYTEIRWPLLRKAVATWFPGRWVGPRPVASRGEEESFAVRFAYTALAPLMRLAPPALAYPALFPRVLGYFGLDLAADLAGLGRMPDDNLVVYGAMYGQLDKGAVSVPFQYSWFSQIGLFGALFLCIPLGAATEAAWRASLCAGSPEIRAVMGGLVVLFAVHVTQDSVRGSLLNSYGVAWGALLVLAMSRAFRSRTAALQSVRS